MHRKIDQCRISGSTHLLSILDLGIQQLTGTFRLPHETSATTGPLELVWCPDSGLVQLGHSYDLTELYGEGYGYRSGLNSTMVDHLKFKRIYLSNLCNLDKEDTIIDIGSNDGTLLNAFCIEGIKRVGIDPSAKKFQEYYDEGIILIEDFFSREILIAHEIKGKAKIITSIAMFYDLDDPNKFIGDIVSSLHPQGIWHFEQSYLPSMLRTNAYDTVCHEHLEYYSLSVIKDLLTAHQLRIIDVQMNSINGGSFAVTACHQNADYVTNKPVIDWMLEQELRMNLDTPQPYRQFETRVFAHRTDLRSLVHKLRESGKSIAGYGASTKGNVLLQFCNFTSRDIDCIAEINKDKFGKITPGSGIPILPETDVRAMRPDYMLVMPWHFRESILRRERDYLASGGKLIFPLPEIEII